MKRAIAPSPAPPAGARPLSLADRVRSLRLPDRSAAPARGRTWLPWALCVLFFCTTVAAFALRPDGAPAKDDDAKKAAALPQAGQADSLGDIALEAKGYIVPVQQIQVSPKVSGMVVNSISSVGWEEQNLLRGAFPDIDFKDILILQEGRKPTSPTFSFGMMGGGGALMLVGLGLMFVSKSF